LLPEVLNMRPAPYAKSAPGFLIFRAEQQPFISAAVELAVAPKKSSPDKIRENGGEVKCQDGYHRI
jgi:hypothetical protein